MDTDHAAAEDCSRSCFREEVRGKSDALACGTGAVVHGAEVHGAVVRGAVAHEAAGCGGGAVVEEASLLGGLLLYTKLAHSCQTFYTKVTYFQ